MSTENTPTTSDAPEAPVGADEDDVGADVIASLQAEQRRLSNELDSLREENEQLRSELEATTNLARKAHERIHDLESTQSSVSDATELEIALQQSDTVIEERYSVAEQRALVMAHYTASCGGPRGVRISDDTFQRSVEHELEESLAWAQLDRAADALASMAGDAVEHVSDGDGNRLVVNDDSVLPD
ncbi:hypothetical protein [Halorubrum sp. AJ67]|uniref:hypothetical protein n=1 Tax=Halorubrum sp. AJ67 TaxID=1173487 RepID=UPI0003DD4AA5|nr:hypothetical protein [Halorubrum sp. AJ67]CDK39629.1 hypothetical protein BN903_28 [Halorubrum sp. AJ67]